MTRSLILIILTTASLLAQKQPQVDRIFAAYNTHTPGCAVGVSERGTVVLKSGYGMADLERNVPITAGTVFESGSVAKQFTAFALLLLAQQGKISLDDPLRKYLPELQDYGTPLTIRHVISHMSGFREWRPIAQFSDYAEGLHVMDNNDILKMAAMQRGLNFDPGSRYTYSNTGYNIAPILIERALNNGKTFQDFTREAIFEPLQMTHTRWRDDFRAIVPNRALAYEPAGGGAWSQRTPIYNIIGAGGMLSTVGDWLLWNENFTHAKVGGPDLVKAQQKPATLTSGKTISYAAGLMIGKFEGAREVSHGGATAGYRTWLGRYPDHGISVAVMCNASNAVTANLGRDVARLWLGSHPVSQSNSSVPDPTKLEKLAGMYRNVRDNAVLNVRVKDGKLTLSPGPALVPSGDLTFKSGETQYVFSNSGFQRETADDTVVYERVEPADPSATELAAYVGKYTSPETTASLSVEVKGKDLMLAIGSSAPARLRPTFRDAFDMQGTAIRFLRDASGSVTALSAGSDRVWDLRFTRVR